MKIIEFHHAIPRFSSLMSLPAARVLNARIVLMIVLLLGLAATKPVEAAAVRDPFITVNRSVFQFNKIVDSVLFKPIAKTYDRLTPRFAKKGIRNILSNLNDVKVTANDLLQLKFKQAASDLGRLTINSTLGLGGIIDVASNVFDLQKHDEDFGQTLAHWGVDRGPYLVLPLLGPSTVRESGGLITDFLSNPIMQTNDSGARDKMLAAKAVDIRASLLSFEELIIGDEYLFVRGMYLQHLEYRSAEPGMQVAFEEF